MPSWVNRIDFLKGTGTKEGQVRNKAFSGAWKSTSYKVKLQCSRPDTSSLGTDDAAVRGSGNVGQRV